MATQIIKTIGSGGDYSTLADAVAAIPASLVSADEQWELRMLSGEHTLTAQVSFTGKTQDSTRYIHLTANPGVEFWANATNPLRYGYGARLKWTSGGDGTYNWIGNLRLGSYGRLSNLQLLSTEYNQPNTSGLIDVLDYCRITRCYIECSGGDASGAAVVLSRDGNLIANCVIVRSGNNGAPEAVKMRTSTATMNAANRAVNCLAIRTSDRSAGTAFGAGERDGAALVTDCMALGPWSSATYAEFSSRWAAGCGRFVVSVADGTTTRLTPGTGNTFSITATSQIEGLSSSAALDARLKSGFTSYAGQRNQSDTGDVDIYGQARSTSAPQIGAQESIPSGGDTLAPNVPSPTVGTRTASQITWSWSAVADNGGGSTAGYQVQLLDGADAVLATTDIGSTLSYTCPSTTGATTRKLKVLAYDNAVPRNNSAYSAASSSTTLSKTATFTVKDANGTAQASESSLRWAACSGTVGSALTVVAQGTAETTDGSGNCVIDLNSTSLSAGNSITVILADDAPSARLGVLEGITVSEA
jgi:hypothetical protein